MKERLVAENFRLLAIRCVVRGKAPTPIKDQTSLSPVFLSIAAPSLVYLLHQSSCPG